MFKLVVAFVAFAAFQGACASPIPQDNPTVLGATPAGTLTGSSKLVQAVEGYVNEGPVPVAPDVPALSSRDTASDLGAVTGSLPTVGPVLEPVLGGLPTGTLRKRQDDSSVEGDLVESLEGSDGSATDDLLKRQLGLPGVGDLPGLGGLGSGDPVGGLTGGLLGSGGPIGGLTGGLLGSLRKRQLNGVLPLGSILSDGTATADPLDGLPSEFGLRGVEAAR